MNKQDKLHLRLTLDVIYTLGGEDPQTLKNMIDDFPREVAGEGLLTGDGPAVVDEWHHQLVELPPVLRKPWNRKEIRRNQDKDGYIEAVIPMTLYELVGVDIDIVNDLVEDRIVGDLAILCDIAYTIIGTDDKLVLVKVRAQVESLKI